MFSQPISTEFPCQRILIRKNYDNLNQFNFINEISSLSHIFGDDGKRVELGDCPLIIYKIVIKEKL
jgi:hypothetical protein